MNVNIKAAVDLLPRVLAADELTPESELRQLEDELCRALGDTNFRMTHSTQHHTHHYLRSVDACVGLLGRHAPWLCPVLDYSGVSARLVNGAGCPVNGHDHFTVASTMPAALCGAVICAFADAAARNPEYQQGYVPPEPAARVGMWSGERVR